MYCHQCGTELPEGATRCPSCGWRPPAQPKPSFTSFLVPAILATLFCCAPFGVAAVVYAARVDPLLAGGDPATAEESARKARLWTWIAFGVGLLPWLVYGLVMVIALVEELG